MATYNCTDATNNAYGAADYGTCTTVGAPNTGLFGQLLANDTFLIIAPIAAAVLVVGAAVLLNRRRASKTPATENE